MRDVLWLDLTTPVIGFDDEGESEGSEEEGSEEETEETEEESEEGEEEEGKEKKPPEEKDPEKLKSALRKERMARKKAEREFKRLSKQREEQAGQEKSEAETAKQEATTLREANVKLATKLKDQAIDILITKFAQKAKFRDLDDALRLVNRADIEVDQDEENPADLEVDESSVEEAVKSLATKKKHLISASGEEGESGGDVGSRSKGDKGLSDEALKEKYPALRR